MKRPQIEFDLELILDLINNKGYMMKDVCEHYNCKRSQLSWFTRKHGLNFNNNPNARKNQSKLMSGDMNPTKGRKRTKEEMKGTGDASRKRYEKEWENKFREGINYNQYTKISRRRAYTNMGKVSVKGVTEVDHIYSLKDCWANSIHPIYASDIVNLQLLTTEENKKKAGRSDITLQELLDRLNIKDLKDIQFNWPKI